MEDKQAICDWLLKAIKMTRVGDEIERLTYVKADNHREHVVVEHTNGFKRTVNVSMDSGCALIRDVMETIN